MYISDNEPFDREVAKSLKNVDKNVVRRYLAAERGPEPADLRLRARGGRPDPRHDVHARRST